MVAGSRAAVVAALSLVLSGCATKPETQLASSVNAFYFLNARYEEQCVNVVGPVEECRLTAASLRQWKKALGESDEAVKRGGKLPLQIKYVKRLEKETKKWLPR